MDRLHAGHDLVKFFYGAIRQLPHYLVEAVLDMNVSVTLVHGPDLLVFHHPREHQSFHTGRTRRTIYIPEAVIFKAFELGYDYWALSEMIIQESWPLLDYLVILEFVRRAQQHFKGHFTLGCYFIHDNLHQINKHRHDSKEDDDDEFDQFMRYYGEHFFGLKRAVVERDPFDVADEIFDKSRERFWATLKLHDLCQVYMFSTYFHIDRDIVHGAALRIARKLSMPLEPQTPEDILHDLWDEARFKLSRSIKTEELLERLIDMGSTGIKAFVETVAEEQVFGYHMVTVNRYDGFDVSGTFKKMLQRYSSSQIADLPGCLGFSFNALHAHHLQVKRYELLQRYKEMGNHDQDHNWLLVRDMVYRVIEVRLHPDRAFDFKRRIEMAGTARVLIEAGEELMQLPAENEEYEHLGAILAQLDRHRLYHSEFLSQHRELTGNPDVVLKENIQPEVERLLWFVPERAFVASSDPQGVVARLRLFNDARAHNPDNKELFSLLAAVFVRLDLAEDYAALIEHARAVGEYARPEMEYLERG